MIKHLGINLKRPEVLLCFNYQNGIIDEEEDPMFANEPELFSIGTISLILKTLDIIVVNIIWLAKIIENVDFKTKPSCHFKDSVKIAFDKKPKVRLDDKVYLETYYHHMSGQV